jgi:hypothetical protein
MLQLCGTGMAMPYLSMVARSANIALRTHSHQSATFEGTDDQLLEEIQRASFEFFWNEASPNTGQVKDRARAEGKDSQAMSSVAATGFGLVSLCIGDKREYRKSAQILERVKRTLRFLVDGTPNVHGFYYHFIHMETGKRWEKAELSSIDTCLLLCGVLTARQYFADQEIKDLGTKIYERVDWRWMLNGGTTVSMGWHPESGFLDARWEKYCESFRLYCFNEYARKPVGSEDRGSIGRSAGIGIACYS